MKLQSAHLSVFGRLWYPPLQYSQVNHDFVPALVEGGPDWNEDHKPRFHPDYDYAVPGPHCLDQELHVVALLAAKSTDDERDTYYSLVLRCVDWHGNTFERIGLLQHDFVYRGCAGIKRIVVV